MSVVAPGTIVLSGFMATGKSTVGALLARRLGVPFVDTDQEIERATGKSVPELWRAEGESAFRDREDALVSRLFADGSPRVIAFGGGTVTRKRSRHLALEKALLVTLRASPEAVAARVPDLATRPNLAVGGDAVARARDLMAARAPDYAECHLSLMTDDLSPAAAVEAIVALAARAPLAVPLGDRSYVVDVVHDSPATLTDAIARLGPSSLVLVTDANVQRARHAAIDAALRPLAAEVTHVALAAGEEHKTLASVGMIWDAALGTGVDREAVVVGFGGGVVGDLSGFAASSLLRGLRTVLVPTTLLSMLDASVGGKTGFDHPTGKNLLGAFHQPSAVVADLEHLKTLPARDRTAGLAEAVKIALTSDSPLLAVIEANAARLAAGDIDALMPVVRRAVALKIAIVRDDEREQGVRALLNLGHTVGHAIEAHEQYRKHLHGEAVAIGTVAELEATARLGHTPPELVVRARDIFQRLGLPTGVPHAELVAAWPFVAADKKRTKSRMKLPIVTAPGVARIETIALETLKQAILG